MRLKGRDLVATILIVAVAAQYVAYLVYGGMPFVKDARGMVGVGLAFGALAFGVLKYGDTGNPLTGWEIGMAGVSLALGITALALAATVAAGALLALFMVSILVVCVAELLSHAGWRPGHSTGASRTGRGTSRTGRAAPRTRRAASRP